MRVAITGADGMLGAHIVRAALAAGHRVRAALQPGRASSSLDGLDAERVEAELLDPASLRSAFKGCDAVVNAAALTDVWPARSTRVRAVNYGGAVAVAEAVLGLGIGKLVHIGTANSFGPGPKSNPGTEDSPYTDARYGLDYQDSKRAAQEELLRLHAERGLPVSVINPSFMFGAYDAKPGSGAMILAVHAGAVPGYARGGKSYAYAGDVASAAVAALERGVNGRCYLASGENLSYTEAFSLIAQELGVPSPRLALPAPAVLAVGALGSLAGALSGKAPKLSLPMARLANAECYYSNARAVAELGMPCTPLRTAVREAFEWFAANGYLDRGRKGRR